MKSNFKVVEETAFSKVSKRATVVVKLGGSSLQNTSTLDELARVVIGYRARGFNVVLVHGGGPAINAELRAQNIDWTFVNGQRRTTPEMMNVIDDVLANKVNGAVVESLREAGIPARGLSGAANAILHCSQLNAELGLVGGVDHVATEAINEVLAAGQVPVIAPIGLGASNLDPEANEVDGLTGYAVREMRVQRQRFNVNADWAATKIAIAMRAEKLIFLTDQNGILNDKKQLVRTATPPVLHGMIESGVVSGGMCTKVLAMMAALEQGVAQVRVLNASTSSGILGRARVGTVLTPAKEKVHGYAS